MKCKNFKRLLSLIVAVAMFLSMGTGVFAEAMSQSDIPETRIVSRSDVSRSDVSPSDVLIPSAKANPPEEAVSPEADEETTAPEPVSKSANAPAEPQTEAKREVASALRSSSDDFVIEDGVLTEYVGGGGEVVIPDSVNKIGNGVFKHYIGLESITLSNSVTEIGPYAFYDCKRLKNVKLSESLNKIDDHAFADCTELTGVTLPGSLTAIVANAFSGCTGLKSITIPDSVTWLGGNSFSGCTGLTSVTIPKSVTTIGTKPFSDCKNLTSIFVDSNNPNFAGKDGVLYNKKMTKIIQFPPNRVGSYAMPNSVTSIEDRTFINCFGLTDITISDAVTTLGDYAFYDCTSLSVVSIGKAVTSIGSHTFGNCVSIQTIVIPDSITTLGESAFESCTGLKNITLGSSVRFIGNDAFRCCSDLENAILCDHIKSIGNNAFGGCTKLTSITLPDSVTTIGYGAFSGCLGLTSVTMPNNITLVNDGIFSGCTGLVSISLPAYATTIGYGAFYGCSGLTCVIIPDCVTFIADNAFHGCTCLQSVKLGKSVSSIDKWVFMDCSALTEIIIPESLTSFGSGNFAGCNNIKDVYYAGTEEQWNKLTTGIPGNPTVHFNSQKTPLTISGQPQNTTVNLGDSISFSVSAQGDGLTYQWYYRSEKDSFWTKWNGQTASKASVVSDATWNGMQVYCQVTDESGSMLQSDIATVTLTYNTNFTTSLPSPQEQNTTIVLKATGGSQYKFYYKYNNTWTRLQDVSENNQCNWTPTAAGQYKLYADIMDAEGNLIETRKMYYDITRSQGELKATMTAHYASPQTAGTTIKLTVSASGGIGTLKYKFYSECNGIWTKLWDYDTMNTYNWHATTVGTHTVYCDVKDETGKVICTLFLYQIVASEDFVADLNANRISGQYTGTKIKLLADSTNGSGEVQYKFYAEKKGIWTRLRDFSTKDYFLWTPTKAGFYNVYVDAKDSSGKVASKRLCITIEQGTPLKVKSLAANPSAPTKGNPVTLTGTTTGGESPVTYKFYYELNGSWVKIQDFGSSNTCTFTPSKAGTYHIYMDAIDGKKNTQCLMIIVTVK